MGLDNVKTVKIKDKEIILIGTAHVSKISAEQVKELIEETHPDSVCVELDEERFNSIQNSDKWGEMDIIKIIKQKKSLFLLVNLIIGSFQKRMARQFGINQGQEMIQGIESARKIDAQVVLADRNIQITFKRVWRGLRFFEKIKLVLQIISMLFVNEDISEEDIEKLKSSDSLTNVIAEIAREFPGIKRYLIDERDKYLAHKIKTAPGSKIVAVLGAAHLPGVMEEIKNEQDIIALTKVPPGGNKGKYLAWIIPFLILAIIGYTFYTSRVTGIGQIMSWVIWNGSLSALGVLLARGHMLTILTAFIVAPISSLNPMIAAGWFAGIVESLIRKPRVKDFETLSNDLSIKSLGRNRVVTVLLVVVLANLGSVLGTVIGGADIIRSFIGLIN